MRIFKIHNEQDKLVGTIAVRSRFVVATWLTGSRDGMQIITPEIYACHVVWIKFGDVCVMVDTVNEQAFLECSNGALIEIHATFSRNYGVMLQADVAYYMERYCDTTRIATAAHVMFSRCEAEYTDNVFKY